MTWFLYIVFFCLLLFTVSPLMQKIFFVQARFFQVIDKSEKTYTLTLALVHVCRSYSGRSWAKKVLVLSNIVC